MTQEELTRAYQEIQGEYQDAGRSLNGFSLEQMQTLITYECWSDGAEFDIAQRAAAAFQEMGAARHYLEQAFGY